MPTCCPLKLLKVAIKRIAYPRKDILLCKHLPFREVDSMDLRKKLPFCVGLLLRLLRKNFRVFLTCTTGFERSPACVIAYLHWIQDTALHAAHNFVTGLHSCRPDRFVEIQTSIAQFWSEKWLASVEITSIRNILPYVCQYFWGWPKDLDWWKRITHEYWCKKGICALSNLS